MDTNFIKFDIEELIGCSKLHTRVVLTKLLGRSFKREIKTVLQNMEGRFTHSTALLEKQRLQIFSRCLSFMLNWRFSL